MRLTLLLATQRSGSTLLEYSLSNLGGLGRLREHFAPFVYRSRRHPLTARLNRLLPPAWVPEKLRDAGLRHAPPGTLSPMAFNKLLLGGRDDSGAVGVTLMSDYLSLLARGYLGRPQNGKAFETRACQRFLESLSQQFDECHVLRNRRGNALDQAISRYLAGKTGQAHLVDGAEVRSRWVAGITHEEAVERFRIQELDSILEQLDQEEQFLTGFLKMLDWPVLEVRYEDVVKNPAKVAGQVLAFTGLEGDPQRFTSPTQKVGQESWVQTIKQKAAESLAPGENDVSDQQLLKALRQKRRSNRSGASADRR